MTRAVLAAIKSLPPRYRHAPGMAGVIGQRPSVEAVLAELADLEHRGLVARTRIYAGSPTDPDRVLYELTEEGRARC
jgi:hypothetical protein